VIEKQGKKEVEIERKKSRGVDNRIIERGVITFVAGWGRLGIVLSLNNNHTWQ
jgi:hypothetical protein